MGFEDFAAALSEEMAVSGDFSLPLTLLAVEHEGGWDGELAARAVGTLRAADLVSNPAPPHLVVALPNTGTEDARVVERRIREAVPGVRVGVAAFERGDTVEALVDRAIAAVREV